MARATMKAARYRRTGTARDVLEVTELERPEPGPGEVRVRMHLSGVNPTDWKTRSGETGAPPDGWQIPNQDGAGEIDAVGEGVETARVGQRVWVWFAAKANRWGTAAQWSVLPAERAVPLPDGASDEMGASLGVPAITAHRCLFADGPLDGASVLVAGGAGAVGHFAIELARRAGARVASTVSSEEKAELARRAGAELVVNYRTEGYGDEIRAFSPTYDRIIEVALGSNLDLDLSVSGPQTTIVNYASDQEDPVLPVRRCMTANVALRFVLLYGVPKPALARAVADVNEAMACGALTPLPVRRFPLEAIADAHDAVEARAVGKVLVDLP